MQQQTTRPVQTASNSTSQEELTDMKRKASDAIGFDDYFVGPRDLDHHSKWPIFLRLHGSIMPEIVLRLWFVGGWAIMITCLSKWVYDRFVGALSLSFRLSTAYERYNEGRRYWSQLALVSQQLARLIWVHAEERHNDPCLGKSDLLAKISCLNAIVAYAVALKHRLRFEPYAQYEDLQHAIAHLDTLAKAIAWVYILVLPFQLYKNLRWITIPATIFAAYIILGIALIGHEIKNPSGNDVNDLPLDAFCDQIREDVDLIMSKPTLSASDFIMSDANKIMHLLSRLGAISWAAKSLKEIREALKQKSRLRRDQTKELGAGVLTTAHNV
ncbi:hypothetical protein OPT61_g563 [Boeremia exigua]|uniref:Uncharacterized protein n=1 Tax=Boeremia exigua TaxID=749465 RepID=A0ACC2ITL5_9PLEO|nr:hypothetical protein OPT61_g563 [Boeremia exigua]